MQCKSGFFRRIEGVPTEDGVRRLTKQLDGQYYVRTRRPLSTRPLPAPPPGPPLVFSGFASPGGRGGSSANPFRDADSWLYGEDLSKDEEVIALARAVDVALKIAEIVDGHRRRDGCNSWEGRNRLGRSSVVFASGATPLPSNPNPISYPRLSRPISSGTRQPPKRPDPKCWDFPTDHKPLRAK